jgi:hypothetical protein
MEKANQIMAHLDLQKKRTVLKYYTGMQTFFQNYKIPEIHRNLIGKI